MIETKLACRHGNVWLIGGVYLSSSSCLRSSAFSFSILSRVSKISSLNHRSRHEAPSNCLGKRDGGLQLCVRKTHCLSCEFRILGKLFFAELGEIYDATYLAPKSFWFWVCDISERKIIDPGYCHHFQSTSRTRTKLQSTSRTITQLTLLGKRLRLVWNHRVTRGNLAR